MILIGFKNDSGSWCWYILNTVNYLTEPLDLRNHDAARFCCSESREWNTSFDHPIKRMLWKSAWECIEFRRTSHCLFPHPSIDLLREATQPLYGFTRVGGTFHWRRPSTNLTVDCRINIKLSLFWPDNSVCHFCFPISTQTCNQTLFEVVEVCCKQANRITVRSESHPTIERYRLLYYCHEVVRYCGTHATELAKMWNKIGVYLDVS